MATHKRTNEPTPSGGAYSEIYFFNDAGEPVDETIATKCAIRECTQDGNLLNEIWATCNEKE